MTLGAPFTSSEQHRCWQAGRLDGDVPKPINLSTVVQPKQSGAPCPPLMPCPPWHSNNTLNCWPQARKQVLTNKFCGVAHEDGGTVGKGVWWVGV